MIKVLVKLAATALVANALFRVGSEYLTFIRFRDAIRGTAMYRAKTVEELRSGIITLAADYDIPLSADDISITRENRLVTVKAPYRKAIDLLPQYPVQWPFAVSLQVQVSAVDAPPEPVPR